MPSRGASYALISAALFGLSTPLAKRLGADVPPLLLAGLLYAGSAVGLAVLLAARRVRPSPGAAIAMPRGREWLWLGAAILLGGIAGPVALMYGLVGTPAAAASLLLNLEPVFTALLAWFLFAENFDRRIALGMLAIVGGGVVLAWAPGGARLSSGSLLVAVACLCWALDNNLTRRVAGADAVLIACLKGTAGALVNVTLALSLGERFPGIATMAAAAAVGLLGYGISLVLFVLALRHLGTARTGAYFSAAPFFGALVALGFPGEHATPALMVAGVLMGLGVWLHLTERHAHMHSHEPDEHTHAHAHDAHHQHTHDFPWDGKEPHTHRHVHAPLVHAHPHYPDLHHRHGHEGGSGA